MRKWRPPDAPAQDEWQDVHQIYSTPTCCQKRGIIVMGEH